MTWLHRLTIFAYAFMAASSAFSASLPTGHVWHIGPAWQPEQGSRARVR